MSTRAATASWALCALVACGLALVTLSQWARVAGSGSPLLYGEGAVANAALVLREGDPYSDASGAVAANYPPEYLALASVGDPLRTGRLISLASALGVSVLIWWRASRAGGLVRVALAAAWLALPAVALWGPAVKPDLLAVATTLFGVALLDGSARGARAAEGGALLAVGAWIKPTELLPVAAVIAWIALRDRPALRPALLGAGALSLLQVAWVASLGLPDVWRHVVVWNALSWTAEMAFLLVVLGVATVGLLVAAIVVEGAATGLALAYLLGGAAVVALGGRQGSTLNYLLDIGAAALYTLATVAPRLRLSPGPALAVGLQVVLAAALLDPFALVGPRVLRTGGWGDPARVEAIRELGAGDHLVEDSGLLVAAGLRPAVDDLFLWRQLATLGLIDPTPVVDRVRGGGFASVVSEVDLALIQDGPAYERARWHPDLVAAVLQHYRLERSYRGLWVYRPR